MSTMKSTLAVVAATAVSIVSFASLALPGHAQGDEENQNIFVRVHESKPEAHEAKVTRAEVLAKTEKAFAKLDTKKEGKLDKNQYEIFLKELTAESGS